MKSNVIIAAFVLGLTIPAAAQRQKVNIDFDWNFRKDGEIQWRRVDVPHDFSIEGPYSESNPATGQESQYCLRRSVYEQHAVG